MGRCSTPAPKFVIETDSLSSELHLHWKQVWRSWKVFTPRSRSKIISLLIIEPFDSRILNMKIGSLPTRSFRHIQLSLFVKGFAGLKTFQSFEEQAPRVRFSKAIFSSSVSKNGEMYVLEFLFEGNLCSYKNKWIKNSSVIVRFQILRWLSAAFRARKVSGFFEEQAPGPPTCTSPTPIILWSR